MAGSKGRAPSYHPITEYQFVEVMQQVFRRLDYLNAQVYDLREQRGWRGVRAKVLKVYGWTAFQVNRLCLNMTSPKINPEAKDAVAASNPE